MLILSSGRRCKCTSDIYINPDYKFHDANLKYSGKAFENDNYFISLYAGSDEFDFSVTREDKYETDAAEKNRQYGGSGVYNRVWNNGSSSNLSVAFTSFNSDRDRVQGIKGNQSTQSVINTINEVQEFSLKLNHSFKVGLKQQIEVGSEYKQYNAALNGFESYLYKPSIYATDNFTFGKLSLSAGVRAEFIVDKETKILPRISGKYLFNESFTATASWGLYSQNIAFSSFKDTSEAYQFAWQIPENTMRSMHSTVGLAYSKNGFLASTEFYYKQTDNVTRLTASDIYFGKTNNIGIDVFLKKEFGKNTLFGSYSLLNISDPVSETGQEFKIGGIAALSPFYISTAFVYGTGFSNFTVTGQGKGRGQNTGQTNKDYSRLDIAATYRLHLKIFTLQAGISILNVLGTENIKYHYQISDKTDVTNVYTKAIPFTPMLFLEILF